MQAIYGQTPNLVPTPMAGPASKAAVPGLGGPKKVELPKADNALANLRARAFDIHARLLELRDAVLMLRDGVGPARNAPWRDFLSKYETLAKLFSQLTDELERAVYEVGFQSLVLQPCGVAEDPDLVPNMLRTKLEPDVEKDIADLQAEYERDTASMASAGGVRGGGPGASGSAAAAAAAASSAKLAQRILTFNAFLEGARGRYEEEIESIFDKPRPANVPGLATTARAQALLTALTTGAPLP